ncbi:STAS/SEC14 domain-containing protein [Desulfovibrio sp. JC010]|uniref:STAS/SEC14 domain-containing protein n=1 Tax=Desulfovibrio sp. JC010 TaxID=2593641 RepID=UPI0013D7C82D|nr:STAS/SEC14 domain-containing protein [Desulfovibrio sp. JC010]NDV27420.1 STAS/SEC14 domain-containing protein [Desulfovibrio sp. JC010]
MIEIIEIAPKVLGLKIKGKIREEDMQNMISVCEKKMESEERIAVYVEVVEMGGITFDALIEDLKFALPNLKRFFKKAVVSENKWHEPLIKIGDKLFPSIEVRHFSPEQKDEALKWVQE